MTNVFHNAGIAKAEASLKARRRVYPKFKDGMTPSEYVHQFYGANAMRWVPTSFGIQRGAYTASADFEILRREVNAFFQPLSTLPMFAPTGEVIEEVLA